MTADKESRGLHGMGAWQTVKLWGAVLGGFVNMSGVLLFGVLLWLVSVVPLAAVDAWRGYRLRRQMRHLWRGAGPVYVFARIPASGGIRNVVDAWVAAHPVTCVVVDADAAPEALSATELWARRAARLWGTYKIPMPVVVVIPARGAIRRRWVYELLQHRGEDAAARFGDALAAFEAQLE